MDSSETEKRLIDILVACPRSPDPFGAPVQTLGVAMGWQTAEAKQIVEDLMRRDVIELKADSFNLLEEGDTTPKSQWRWERKGKTEDAK